MEAVGLQDEQDAFHAENPDVPFSFFTVIFENNAGFPASADTAISYWNDMGEPDFPVVADGSRQVIDDTPWEGAYLPGKCALTPDMEILGCYTGHGNSEPFDAIVAHHAANN